MLNVCLQTFEMYKDIELVQKLLETKVIALS
jgi:hypothetical protein